MKKKLSIAALVLILIFSLAGCGSKSAENEYNREELQQYAEAIIRNFSSMSDEDFDQYKSMSDYNLEYTLMMTGFPISGENFRTMIDSWKSGHEDCGEFLEIGDFTMEVSNTGVTLTAPLTGKKRNADLQFSFDEKGQMESITVSAHYSTGEILKKAGLNTVLGMGTVFVVLIFISFIISLFEKIPALEEKFRKKGAAPAAPAPAPVPAAVEPAPAAEADDSELVAVIAAAIAAAEGTTADGFVVRSIKRRKSNKWSTSVR